MPEVSPIITSLPSTRVHSDIYVAGRDITFVLGAMVGPIGSGAPRWAFECHFYARAGI